MTGVWKGTVSTEKKKNNNPQLGILSQSQSCQNWWRTEQYIYQFHIQVNESHEIAVERLKYKCHANM